MKKTYAFVVCCLLQVLLKAQPNPLYATLINKAELQAIERQYSFALNSFDSAFACEQNVFGRDYYNAMICACYCDNLAKAQTYAERLLEKGYPVDSIINNAYCKRLLTYKPFKNSIKKIQQSNGLFKNKPTSPLRLVMDTLLSDDQYFRIRNPVDYFEKEYGRIISQLDSINAHKLIAAIKQYGFPNEFNCGIEAWYSSNFYVVVLHQGFGSPSRKVDFSPYVLTALRNRQVPPNIGVGLYNRLAGGDKLFGTDCFFRVRQKNGNVRYAYYSSYTPELEAMYNQNRRAYGLEALSHYRKKVLYWLKNRDIVFDYRQGVQFTPIDATIAAHLNDLTYIE
jgi:hypothetical protein